MVDTVNIAIAFIPKVKMDFDQFFTWVVFIVSLNEEKSLRVPFRTRRLHILFGLFAIPFDLLLPKPKKGKNIPSLMIVWNICGHEERHHILPNGTVSRQVAGFAVCVFSFFYVTGGEIVTISFHNDLF